MCKYKWNIRCRDTDYKNAENKDTNTKEKKTKLKKLFTIKPEKFVSDSKKE